MSEKKFIVLGGGGDMGSNAVKYLYKILDNNGKNITIGDNRVDVAKEKASNIDSDIGVIKVDANNHEELVTILKNYDILINCIGPNYKYAVSIAKAAIEAGISGTDICDDSDPTLELYNLNNDDPRCKEVTYIYGLGWTPGLTNICAKRASELLDSVHSFHIAWTGDPASEGLAVVEHTLKILSGNVPSYKDGSWIEVPAGKGVARYGFPEPIGTAKVVDVGHPEPITIPRFIQGLKNVTLKGGLVPWANITYILRNYVKAGKTSTPSDINKAAKDLHELMHSKEGSAFIEDVPSTFRVEAIGTKDGKPATLIYSAVGDMGALTSLPAALGAVLISEDKILNNGLLPPEGCIATEDFIDRYELYGPRINIEWL